MGKRGRDRAGFYTAFLHVLDVHYQLESQYRGSDPSRWQPSPRNRPDQFLRWVLDCLNAADSDLLSFRELLEQLEIRGLGHIAHILEHVVVRRVQKLTSCSRAAVLEACPRALYASILMEDSAAELHPQVRKFSRAIVQALDSAWHEALVTAERAHVRRGGSRAAVVLGGLPPGFAALAAQVLPALADSGSCDEPADLTVFQFYCLVTGALPKAPEPWTYALGQLADLTTEDLQLVRSLSSMQVEQLCTLSEDAFSLISLRRTLRCSVAQWQALVDAIAAMPDDDFGRIVAFLEAENRSNPPSFHRVVGKLPPALQPVLKLIVEVKGSCRSRLDFVRKVRGLTERGAWVLARGFDEELARMITHEALSYPLLRRLQAWDTPLWRCIQNLLAEHSAWVTTYLEDKRFIEELFASRTQAKLDLHDIFPKTTTWLAKRLQDNFEEMLYEEASGFYSQAATFSSSIRKQLLENDHIRLEQSRARAVGY